MIRLLQLEDEDRNELTGAMVDAAVPRPGDRVKLLDRELTGLHVAHFEVLRVRWQYEEATDTCSKQRWWAIATCRPAADVEELADIDREAVAGG